MKRKLKRTQVKDSFAVLAMDPSFSAWGWSVLDSKNNILDTGCIKTASEHKKRRIRKGDDTIRRVNEINTILLDVIQKYDITFMVCEQPHGSQNASAAVMIGIVIGIVQTLSDTLQISLEWYSEQDAKKCVLGKRSATKDEMIQRMDELYDVDWLNIKFRDEAVADSLAIHYLACKQSSILKFVNK